MYHDMTRCTSRGDTPIKLVRASPSMMAHQPHLLDFSSPPNPAMAMEAATPFDHCLLALHDAGTDMRGGGGGVPHRVLADTTSSWPQVSLSLYNAAGGSLVGHQQQPFTAPPSVAHNLPSTTMQPFQLSSSKFLGPVKELLGEFCSLEGDLHAMNSTKRAPKVGKWDDVEASSSCSPWANPSLSPTDLVELERRKARLLSMVEEVDGRYRRYREQMRAVELSFEAVAGAGAAQVYTKLALRAMSRHFRCLRDALVGQIRALRKAMGEMDGGGGVAAAPGATKGDTPKLRVLDQCLRQQRAFQQSGAIESYPWRPQRGLPERAVAILRAWLFEHFLHPYPNDVDKHILARQTGLSRSQVSNWFINARVRLWKPMIEDMYTEETKQSDGNQNPSGGGVRPDQKNLTASTATLGESHLRTGNPSSLIPSIVTNGDGHFHSYPSLHGGGGAVSLTLGLQQQPFASSMMQQQSLMLEEEEEEAVLPYRNLMGSPLLHDLAE